MFWIYWNTAWSLIISGIMVATIVAHPDAEFVEIHTATASSAQVKMVQATNRFRIKPSPSVV